MKLTTISPAFPALFIVLSSLLCFTCQAAASSTSGDVCKEPADLVLAPETHLCDDAVCVDMSTAILRNNGSQICQDKGAAQGSFKCTHRNEVVINAKTGEKEQRGSGLCAVPTHHQTSSYAQYHCPDGTAIDVYTKKDGSASFSIIRDFDTQYAVGGFASWPTVGTPSSCPPRTQYGDSRVPNDKLFIECERHTCQYDQERIEQYLATGTTPPRAEGGASCL